MKYRLQDIIDIEHFQNLQDRLNKIYSFPSSIIDNEGNILTATAWQDVCTKFHRKNEEAETLCIKSDQYILSHLHEANPAVSYRCPHGLVDNATPIIIEGIHYGNFFTGQFFMEVPDLKFFRTQARKYGFDEEAYIEAIKQVPIWTQEQLNNYLSFIKGLIAVIAESGLKKLKEIESRKKIEESEERHRSILQTAMEGFWLADIKGRLLEVNEAYCLMSGYSKNELLKMCIADLEVTENSETVTDHMQKVTLTGSDRFESKHRRKDGTIIEVEVSVQFRPEQVEKFVCFLRDITARKRSEESLQINGEKYRTLFENMAQGVFYQNADGVLFDYNDAALEMFGLTPDQFVGKTSMDPQWKVIREDGTILPGDKHPSMVALQTGKPVKDTIVGVYNSQINDYKWLVVNAIPQSHNPGEKPYQVFVTLQDITERKYAEQKHQMLFQEMIDGFALHEIICDDKNRPVDYRFLAVNPAFERLTGLKADTLIGKTVLEVLPDTESYWIQTYGDVALTGKPAFFENYHQGLDRYFQVRAFRHAKNQFACIFVDITERKKAEITQQKLESQLSSAMEIAHLGHWEYDFGDDLFTFNDQFYKIYRTDVGHMGGYKMSSAEYSQRFVHPEDRQLVGQEIRKCIDASDPNFSRQIEHRIIYADGNMGYIAVRFFIIKDDRGKTVKSYGVNQDITDRKKSELALRESEEKFRNFTEQSFVGFYILQDDLFTYVNPKFAEIFGYTVDECMDGMHFRQLVYPEDLTTVQEQIHRRVAGEIDSVQYTFRGVKKTGEIIHVAIYGSSLVYRERPVAIGTILDITKEQEMEKRLAQSQRMEAIGTLAGGIAHDFNNILFPIVGMSEMLMEDFPQNSVAYENAAEIYSAGMRGSDLVKQILAFSRQSEQKKMPIRLQQILKEVMKLIRSTIPANINITQNIQNDCGLVLADPTQVHQIAMNLITNAYHAVETRGGRIDVRLREVEIVIGQLPESNLLPGKHALLSISDTGIGIEPAIIHKIFEPYFTTKEQGKGTGLGLAVVFGIVKEHHGDIKVYSEVEKGTTFNVYLPVIAEAERPLSIEGDEDSLKGHEHIFLVDDEHSIAKLEKHMLERLGYQVTMRVNSIEALEAFRARPHAFDLVISDITMPNMTGDQLARELIGIRPDIPVIICTGFSDRITKENAEIIGVKGFLMKPIVKAEMAKMVRKVLEETKRSGQP